MLDLFDGLVSFLEAVRVIFNRKLVWGIRIMSDSYVALACITVAERGIAELQISWSGERGKRVGEKAGNEEQINGPRESENNSR